MDTWTWTTTKTGHSVPADKRDRLRHIETTYHSHVKSPDFFQSKLSEYRQQESRMVKQEALVSKQLGPKLNKVFTENVSVVSFIKAQPLKARRWELTIQLCCLTASHGVSLSRQSVLTILRA
ncbi:hypothetical protein Q8A73_007188 [Channa argus]|nr:hypothetical protein Q8A73_007188 [Channa argus]